jgi:hypothetical protein
MHLRRLTPLGFTLLSLACGGGGDDSSATGGAGGTSGSGGSSGSGAACATAGAVSFSITDDTNYSFTSTLDIEMHTLKDHTDLVFDWSGLTRDFYGAAFDPAADIDQVLISLWDLTPSELEEQINVDDLPRASNEGAIMVYPDGSSTSSHLLSFGLLGEPLPDEDEIWQRFDTSRADYQFPQNEHTFLLMAATGTDIGRGGRMLSLFNVDPNATQTTLALSDTSTKLTWDVDLERAKPVSVPAGQPSLTIDWSAMTLNGLGNAYVGNQITEAVVAHFDASSVAELESDFLELQSVATGWWSGMVLAGESIDLGTLSDASGAGFPGIDGNGTWMVALFCTNSCSNPAPWSVTILRACP